MPVGGNRYRRKVTANITAVEKTGKTKKTGEARQLPPSLFVRLKIGRLSLA
jgi:hypothetical protein